MRHSLQQKITRSRRALPLAALYAVAVWWADGWFEGREWLGPALAALAAALVVLLNNRHGLMRTYSQMGPCVFVLFGAAALPLTAQVEAVGVQLCFAAAFVAVFDTFQDKTAVGRVYLAFLFIGGASVWFVQALWLVPVWWAILGFYMLSLSGRTFWASVLGVLTPYWFWLGYAVFRHNVAPFVAHFAALGRFAPVARFDGLNRSDTLLLGLVCTAALIGMLHFVFNSARDKICVRLLYYRVMLMTFAVAAFVVLQPVHFAMLLPLLILGSALLAGHFVAFSSSRLSVAVCLALLLFTLVLTGYRLWMV